MQQGIIQGIRIALGIGYIRPDDGSGDLLFRRDALAEGAFEELREGQWATFEIAPGGDDRAPREVRQLWLLAE